MYHISLRIICYLFFMLLSTCCRRFPATIFAPSSYMISSSGRRQCVYRKVWIQTRYRNTHLTSQKQQKGIAIVMKVANDRWSNCGRMTCLPWSLRNIVSGKASTGGRAYEDAPLLDLYSMMVDDGRCKTTRILFLFHPPSPTGQTSANIRINDLKNRT